MDLSFDWGLAPEPQCGGGADWDGTSWARNQTLGTTQKWPDNEDVLESFWGDNVEQLARSTEGGRPQSNGTGQGVGIWHNIPRVPRRCVRYRKVDLPWSMGVG